MFAGGRNAGRVNLGKAGVGKEGPPFVGAPDGGCIAAFGVSRQKEDVTIASGRQDDSIPRQELNFHNNHIDNHNL